MVLATRCGFPATAPLAEKVDCKDDQDGHGTDVQGVYQDGHHVQDDHQDDRDHDVQDDYHEDQDILDNAFVINITPTPFLVALIFGSSDDPSPSFSSGAFHIECVFPLQTDVAAINESQMPLFVSLDNHKKTVITNCGHIFGRGLFFSFLSSHDCTLFSS